MVRSFDGKHDIRIDGSRAGAPDRVSRYRKALAMELGYLVADRFTTKAKLVRHLAGMNLPIRPDWVELDPEGKQTGSSRSKVSARIGVSATQVICWDELELVLAAVVDVDDDDEEVNRLRPRFAALWKKSKGEAPPGYEGHYADVSDVLEKDSTGRHRLTDPVTVAQEARRAGPWVSPEDMSDGPGAHGSHAREESSLFARLRHQAERGTYFKYSGERAADRLRTTLVGRLRASEDGRRRGEAELSATHAKLDLAAHAAAARKAFTGDHVIDSVGGPRREKAWRSRLGDEQVVQLPDEVGEVMGKNVVISLSSAPEALVSYLDTFLTYAYDAGYPDQISDPVAGPLKAGQVPRRQAMHRLIAKHPVIGPVVDCLVQAVAVDRADADREQFGGVPALNDVPLTLPRDDDTTNLDGSWVLRDDYDERVAVLPVPNYDQPTLLMPVVDHDSGPPRSHGTVGWT